ncbi:MAG: hypothetical protein ACR2IF_15470 [Terriglobales bacterium]
MQISHILTQLEEERDRLNEAIAALQRITPTGTRAPARHAGKRRKRRLTPEGRKRLSEMMKKRWAERKKRMRAA